VTTTGAATGLIDAQERQRLGRRAQLLAGVSVGYNLLEAAVAITAGLVAWSVALVGFGLDSGKALGSNAVVADSTQTLLCTYLSAVLLAGLLLNLTLGWSWADPIAGLVIAAVAVKEGREAWRGEGCCAPAGQAGSAASATDPTCQDGCC
jgi:divalent metal cation (Fe/Co/Zn/Cd) transporter